jgi:hypothetical protein
MRQLIVAACLGLLHACTLDAGKSGAACQRSAQCEPGLACVTGKCGKDLRSIAATNTVPMLGAGRGGSAAAAGGMGGASAGAAGSEP